jgi:hypothetical protein
MPQNPVPLPKGPEKKPVLQTPEEIQTEIDKKLDETFMLGYKDVSMDDLISRGYVAHLVKLTDKYTFKIRTLKKKEELDVKKRLASYDGAQIYVMDEANVDTLTYAVLEINGEPLPLEDEKEKDEVKKTAFDIRKEIVIELSDAIAIALTEELRDLNKALVILLRGSSKNSLARRLLGPEQT